MKNIFRILILLLSYNLAYSAAAPEDQFQDASLMEDEQDIHDDKDSLWHLVYEYELGIKLEFPVDPNIIKGIEDLIYKGINLDFEVENDNIDFLEYAVKCWLPLNIIKLIVNSLTSCDCISDESDKANNNLIYSNLLKYSVKHNHVELSEWVMDQVITFDPFEYRDFSPTDGWYGQHNRYLVKCMKILLDKGYKIDNKDSYGRTWLHNTIIMFIDYYEDDNDIDNAEKYTDLVSFLLNEDANIDIKDNNENTPLDLAYRVEEYFQSLPESAVNKTKALQTMDNIISLLQKEPEVRRLHLTKVSNIIKQDKTGGLPNNIAWLVNSYIDSSAYPLACIAQAVEVLKDRKSLVSALNNDVIGLIGQYIHMSESLEITEYNTGIKRQRLS